jgi:branched-chain amino acid transport system substrate-binding protein
VNDEGGLNGHLVELHVADDGGDPARHRAIVQEMIERQGVIAFVANPEAQSGAGSVDYVTSKGVPVIGGDTAFEWMYQSPMYFPQATSGHSLLYGVLAVTADEARAQGRRRFGSITCVEGQICADADRIWAAYAARVGLEPVFRARASLAQPDFTAECLQARQHGVEVWQLVLDQNSVQRLAAACARQGFHPLYAVANSIVDNRLRTDPNLAGALGDLNVFPFFQTDTPATAEFSAAMGRYADRLEFGAGEATGWVAGKLFERALRAVPDPPTSQALLRGLWSLENETLGGITQPLTFHEGQRAPRDPACLFKVGIKDGTWASLDGFHLHCSALPPDFG